MTNETVKTDVVIIGAGTAGLTAAIYLCRAQKRVLVFEGMSFGGQIVNTPSIENYPVAPGISGFDFAMKLYEQAKALGAEIRFEQVTAVEDGDVKRIHTASGVTEAGAVILAMGSRPRKLGLPGEDMLVGRGISYCATCDGAFFRKKNVAVVGGGNTALEDALYLAGLANEVTLIHRRDSFRGEDATARLFLEKPNARVRYFSRVTGLEKAEKRLSAIEITKTDGSTEELALDGLFVAIGRIPETELVRDLVDLDDAGYIVAGEDCKTSREGFFAAGDVRTKSVRQLVTAASDGAVSATGAVHYLALREKKDA